MAALRPRIVARLLATFASGALSLQNLPNQIAMLAWKLETFDEAKVILIYRLVGTVQDIGEHAASDES